MLPRCGQCAAVGHVEHVSALGPHEPVKLAVVFVEDVPRLTPAVARAVIQFLQQAVVEALGPLAGAFFGLGVTLEGLAGGQGIRGSPSPSHQGKGGSF